MKLDYQQAVIRRGWWHMISSAASSSWMENVTDFYILTTYIVTGRLCVCVCRGGELTYNVGGHKHARQCGALEETQQQEDNGAVGQTHGHPEQTWQAGGHEEAVSTPQPENTHQRIQLPHTHTHNLTKESVWSVQN